MEVIVEREVVDEELTIANREPSSPVAGVGHEGGGRRHRESHAGDYDLHRSSISLGRGARQRRLGSTPVSPEKREAPPEIRVWVREGRGGP